MKKSFSILGAFCLGLFISVAVIACAVDDDSATKPSSKPSSTTCVYPKVTQIKASNVDVNFEYDSIGRICGYTKDGTYTSQKINITYSNNQIKMHSTYIDSNEESSVIFEVEDLENLRADAINAFVIDFFEW